MSTEKLIVRRRLVHAAQAVIENLEGRTLYSTFNVTNDLDAGAGTFRQAIELANANDGPDRITFSIGAGGSATITPNTPLPDITDTLEIDGTTQPPPLGGPRIELSGDDLAIGGGADGLRFVGAGSQGSVVKGLLINRFDGFAVEINGTSNITVAGNNIGATVDGTGFFIKPQGFGVVVIDSSDNTIGGTNLADRNLISGNGSGIAISGAASTGNLIQGNFIGTTANGNDQILNFIDGIVISNDASNNVIGGSAAGAPNLISGNGQRGVLLVSGAHDNLLHANRIGTSADGDAAVPNGTGGGGNTAGVLIAHNADHNWLFGNLISGNQGPGVAIDDESDKNDVTDNLIGTNVIGTSDLPNAIGVKITGNSDNNRIGGLTNVTGGNVISGNIGDGVLIELGTQNLVFVNKIVINAAGDAAIGNGGAGIHIVQSGSTRVGNDVESGNLISGNVGAGVLIEQSPGTTLRGNRIGTTRDGDAAIGNGLDGILITHSSDTIIGGAVAAAANLISGNGQGGVTIVGGSDDNSIQGNRIGTDATGKFAIGNLIGVHIGGDSDSNRIGDASPAQGNLISGNRRDGILLEEGTANIVLSNRIGTDVDGNAAIRNAESGIHIDGAGGTFVGGASGDFGNLISGNGDHGIFIERSPNTNVRGNRIGTDASGMAAVPNEQGGIKLENGSQSNIGGTVASQRNLISGNTGDAIEMRGSSTNNKVQGNFIGTNALGTARLPNAAGVLIRDAEAKSNVIGGTDVGAGNVISGNVGFGVTLLAGPTLNVIQGNRIGTDSSGTLDLSNGDEGVLVADASSNLVGGAVPEAGNIIAFNDRAGVVVQEGNNNAIRYNSIFSNAGLGIDLDGDGITANDTADADVDSNNRQNFPVLISAVVADGKVTLKGAVNSTPNKVLVLDFFANSELDGVGGSEGRTFIGSATVVTDANGNAVFDQTLATNVAVGQFITATANTIDTDPFADTSEFSSPRKVTTPPLPVVSIGDVTATEGKKGLKAFTFTVTLSAPSSQTVTMKFATANGTATSSNADFDAKSGTLAFAPGETVNTITVYVKGDTKKEADETFFVNLSDVTNATFGDSQGKGTIKNDD